MKKRWIGMAVAIGVLACRPPARQAAALSAGDQQAIRALDSTFVAGWLRDDTASVLGLFDSQAVLLPPGSRPVTGKAAIKAYWWPTDGSHTHITGFSRTITEVSGTPQLAYLRGTAVLSWAYQKSGKTSTQSSRSQDLFLLAPDSAGRWRIIRQMWSTLP